NQVLSLLETRGAVADGGVRTLWVGTFGGGLARLTDEAGEQWRVYDTSNGLPNNAVLSLLETRGEGGPGSDRSAGGGGHALWVGTFGGVARLDLTGETARWMTL